MVSMAFFMGIIKGKNGVYQARKKVPKGWEERAAIAAGSNRPRLSWLKRSLGTKDRKEAAVLAKPVLIEFDTILAKAQNVEVTAERTELTQTEIKKIAEYHYAAVLADDERTRIDGEGSEEVFLAVKKQLEEAGIGAFVGYLSTGVPKYGLSDREYEKRLETIDTVRAIAKDALARGDLTFIEEELDDLMLVFNLKLNCKDAAFRKLGYAVLKAHTLALDAIHERNHGGVIETPQAAEPEPQVTSPFPEGSFKTCVRGHV